MKTSETSPMQMVKDPLVPTVFHEPWWLDIVTYGQYKLVEVSENGKTLARLPYFMRSALGIHYCTMPRLTHFLGPAIIDGEGSPNTRLIKQINLTKELIRQLPDTSFLQIKCHSDIQHTLAFQAMKFATDVQFTMEIAPKDPTQIWADMHHKKRSVITRAEKRVSVEILDDPALFVRFYAENLAQRGHKIHPEADVFIRLIEACLAKGRGKIWAARDDKQNLVGAIFCPWDACACYYHLTTRAEGSHTGVVSLLVWHAIQEAANRGLVFDFDGFNGEGSLAFGFDFGAAIKPRYIVTRETKLFHALYLLRSRWKGENFFTK